MVISQKITEKEMGYRGSKSEIKKPQPTKFSVKEQRVDGSWFIKINLLSLRCTLTDGESCYQFKFPSKQLKNRALHFLV